MTLSEAIISKIEAGEYTIEYPMNGGGTPFVLIGQAFVGLYGEHLTVVNEINYRKHGNRHIFTDAQAYAKVKKALKDKADLGLSDEVEAQIIGWLK